MWKCPHILLLLVLLLPAASAAAGEPADGAPPDTGQWDNLAEGMPLSVDRVVHLFDFEERDDGNFEPMPMHWSRVSGPGLPHYVRGAIERGVARSGRHSFRLDVNGGSALFRLSPSRLAVQPGAFYRVVGHVRTTPLRFARARMTCYFVDQRGLILPETLRHSRLIAAEATEFSPPVRQESPVPGNDWQPLVVELPEAPAAAAFVVLEVGLLQPNLLRLSSGADDEDLGRFRQDVVGSAWFDDLSVCRVPAVQLGSGAAGNIFSAGQPVRFNALIDDQFVRDLAATATVRDNQGRPVAEVEGQLKPDAADAAASRVDFEVPDLPPGWYEVRVDVGGTEQEEDQSEHTRTSSERVMTLVVLADEQGRAPVADSRITVDASHLGPDAWPELPVLLPMLAAGRVKLSVWNRQTGLGPLESGRFDALAESLHSAGIGITGVLAEPTPELIERSGDTDWAALLEKLPPSLPGAGADGMAVVAPGSVADLWYSSLSYLVSRHAAQIERWQIGSDADAARFADEPAMRQVHSRFDAAIVELVHRPDLAMPWPARERFVADDIAPPQSLEIRVPAEVLPRQIPLYIDEFLRTSPVDPERLSIALELPGPHVYGVEAQLTDLAQRLTYGLASGIGRITVPLPFEPVADPASVEHRPRRGPDGQPGGERETGTPHQPLETYFVLRTMLPRLAGHTFAGRLEVDEDVEAYLFAADAPGGGGVVVAWDRSSGSAPRERRVQLNLHRGAHQVDLYGNVRSIARAEQDPAAGWASVAIGSMPTLIVGVDSELTRLRSGMTLDRPEIESRFEPHVRRVRFSNPFAESITGTLDLHGPEGWEIRPVGWPGGGFTLAPGQRFDRPIEIRFPYNSYAGDKTLTARLRLNVEGRQDEVIIPIVVRLGLEDVGLRTVAFREGADLVVEQTVTNYGHGPINYNAFVLAAGQARQERLVMELPGGEVTVRRYRFAGGGKMAGPIVIRSGLRELEGSRILNDRVELP